MNNYCRNCGEKLELGTGFCHKCGTEVLEARINLVEKEHERDLFKKEESKYLVIIISLFALSYLSSSIKVINTNEIISYIKPLVSLGAIITLIYARITLEKSVIIRILFILLILWVLYSFLFSMVIAIACSSFM